MAESFKYSTAESFQDYIRDYSADLISKSYFGFSTSQYLTTHETKDELILTEVVVGDLAKRFATAFNPSADQVEYIPRTLKVNQNKVEFQVIPQNLEGSYLGAFRRAGFNHQEFPFQAFVLDNIMKKFAKELETAVWMGQAAGSPSSSDLMGATFDGFMEIIKDAITATDITPTAGAVSLANIVTLIETMYDNLPTDVKNEEIHCFMKPTTWALYQRAMRDTYGRYHGDPALTRNGVMEVDFANVKLISTPGITNDRIVMTPASNLHYGVDSLSDFNLQTEKNHRALDFWMDFKVGVQIGIIKGGYVQASTVV